MQWIGLWVLLSAINAGCRAEQAVAPPSTPDPHAELGITIEVSGATTEEIERTVAPPLERVISGLPGVISQSSWIGSGRIETRLEYSDVEQARDATEAVHAALLSLRQHLPSQASPPMVTLLVATRPRYLLVQDSRLSALALRRIAKSLVREVQTWTGISRVRACGGDDDEIAVEIDAEKMHGRRLTISDVAEQLNTLGLSRAGVSPEVLADTNIGRSDEIAIQLKDIAVVRQVGHPAPCQAHLGNEPVVVLEVFPLQPEPVTSPATGPPSSRPANALQIQLSEGVGRFTALPATTTIKLLPLDRSSGDLVLSDPEVGWAPGSPPPPPPHPALELRIDGSRARAAGVDPKQLAVAAKFASRGSLVVDNGDKLPIRVLLSGNQSAPSDSQLPPSWNVVHVRSADNQLVPIARLLDTTGPSPPPAPAD